jgi:hypothetical protein
MGGIIDLQTALGSILAKTIDEMSPRFDLGPTNAMRKLADDLARRRALRKERTASPILTERMERAVRHFLNGGDAEDFRTLRHACLGATHYLAKERLVLIADRRALDAVLVAVERYVRERRRFRRLYDCLLRAYLGADRQAKWFASPAAAQGNERLRAFLAASLDDVRKSEPVPEWVQTLASHPEVLSSDPGRRFADGLLAGNPTEFADLSRSLHLTGEAWLATEVVRSAKDVAVSKEHTAFGAHIPALLKVAAEPRFASLRDDVYATVVDRYAAIPGRPIHTHLRDALVAAWRNPWLPLNDSAWGRVSSDARAMVAGWLKQHVIRQFFELLADDWRQDRSRFEFWSQYHEQMTDVYIALGNDAYYSREPELVKLRKDLDGRLLRLNASPDTINAFVMFIDDHVVVEFSQKGNAAYRYDRRSSPVDGAQHVFTVSQLKRADIGNQMRHIGARGLTWQQRFALALGLDAVTRSARVSNQATAPSRAWQQQSPLQPRISEATRATSQPAAPSIDDVSRLAFRHRLRWDNHRARGGNVWVYTSDEDPEISRQLKAWGFAYKPGKGWWRE